MNESTQNTHTFTHTHTNTQTQTHTHTHTHTRPPARPQVIIFTHDEYWRGSYLGENECNCLTTKVAFGGGGRLEKEKKNKCDPRNWNRIEFSKPNSSDPRHDCVCVCVDVCVCGVCRPSPRAVGVQPARVPARCASHVLSYWTAPVPGVLTHEPKLQCYFHLLFYLIKI